MKRLTCENLKKLKKLKSNGCAIPEVPEAPERVLQFGEGNFLRAFAEDFIDRMNEKADFNAKVILVQPRGGHPEAADRFAEQDGLYTLILRGRENGEPVERTRIISCVSRCLDPKRDWTVLLDCAKNPDLRFIISNTTEAGIVFDPDCKLNDAPPASFPAKLTAFLYERWRRGGRGFVILSCELIDHNGEELKRCVLEYCRLWECETAFVRWVENENLFCSTLVDRIVTGSPGKENLPELWEKLGYEDYLIDTGEVFAAWIIEGPQSIKEELPFEKASLPIQITDDVSPYKQRKVRILNGAHTSMVLAAHLAGKKIVRECMEDHVIREFLRKTLFQEIIPTLDLPEQELISFADSVLERFNNPYIDHRLLDIALNSTAKWKARVLPSVTEYAARTGGLPRRLTFSFAAYIAFYLNGEARDDEWILTFFREHAGEDIQSLVRAVVENQKMWNGALSAIPGFTDAVIKDLEQIQNVGAYQAMADLI